MLSRSPGWGWTEPDYEISRYRISSINLTLVTETISVFMSPDSGDSAISNQPIQCKTLLVSEIDRLPGSACPFLFSPVKPGYHDLVKLQELFYEEWASFESNPEQEAIQALREILFPSRPFDITIIEKLSLLDFPVIQDLCIAKILKDISSSGHPQVTPQLYIELLNCYTQRAPEFLVLVDPLLTPDLSGRRPFGQAGDKNPGLCRPDQSL